MQDVSAIVYTSNTGFTRRYAKLLSRAAALPAYDFLMLALQEADDKLQVELLDIFLGFAVCTARFSSEAAWPRQLREKLKADLPIFTELIPSENEDISYFAGRIVEELNEEVE